MKNLRDAYLRAWYQAEQHGGDFKDCLLHYLSIELDMPILNDVPYGFVQIEKEGEK